MGYNVYIGQCVLEESPEGWWLSVEGHSEKNAPKGSSCVVGCPRNCISPSYTSWGKFAREVDLHDELGSQAGSDPRRLTEEDHASFVAARLFYDKMTTKSGYDAETGVDWNNRRLDWLIWWARWTLDNCTRPAIQIT